MQSKAIPRQTSALHKVQLQNYVVYIFFAVVLTFFAITIGDKGFLSVTNLFNIARTTAMVTVIAVAMTFVISAGELDLSVGSTAALSALTCALVMQAGFPWPLAVLAGLASGLIVGSMNGFFVTVIGIPSFLVTLGMMQFIRGLDMRVTYTNPIAVTNKTFNTIFGSGSLFGIPSLVIWSVAVAALGFVVLKYTGFGREVLATGGNRMAAE
jgi:ribose transport system permease protein